MKVKEFLKYMDLCHNLTEICVISDTGLFLIAPDTRDVATRDFGDREVSYWYIVVEHESEIVELNICIK